MTIASSPEELPTLSLPAGCDLLTPGQLEALVPGTPTRAGRGPEVVLDATESACDWANTAPDPDDPRVQAASLEVKATAAVDEESARRTLEISLPCQGTHSTKAIVEGADEACLNHKTAGKDGPADVATVSARYKTLVVEVSYGRRGLAGLARRRPVRGDRGGADRPRRPGAVSRAGTAAAGPRGGPAAVHLPQEECVSPAGA